MPGTLLGAGDAQVNEAKCLFIWSLANNGMSPVITSQQINKKFQMAINAMKESAQSWGKASLHKTVREGPWEVTCELSPT